MVEISQTAKKSNTVYDRKVAERAVHEHAAYGVVWSQKLVREPMLTPIHH